MIAFDALAAECALAVMGLGNVLNGSPSWGAGKAMEARQLPRKINLALTGFISSSGRDGPASALPAFNFDEVAALLGKGPGGKMVDGLTAKVPDPGAASAITAAATAITTKLSVPTRQRTTALGVVPCDPGLIAKGAFRRRWSVANAPMIVFEDLEEGRLSPDMVRAFVSFYPMLNQLVQQMVPRIIAGIRVKREKPDWTPTAVIDRQLAMLMGRDSANDLALGGAFAGLGGAAGAPATPPPKPEDIKSDLSTPGQGESPAHR